MTKIMLVEDDKSLREIYGLRLQAEGYDIKSAGDGEEALAMAVKERPELILADVMMPKISGFDMLDILRSTPETRDIKVIIMTALSSEDQRTRGETLGANRYLVKSQVGIEDVVRTIHDLLGDAPKTGPAPNNFSTSTPTTTSVQPPTPPVIAQPQPMPVPTPIPQPTAPFSTPAPSPMTNNISQTPPQVEAIPTQLNPIQQSAQPALTPPQMAPAPAITPIPDTADQINQEMADNISPQAPTQMQS